MKFRLLPLLLVAALSGHPATAANPNWMTDYPAAQAQAQGSGKHVLLLFTGSDWCPACIEMNRTAWSRPEFHAYARDKLVLVEIDFPEDRPLPPAQQQANAALSERFRIEAYPTVVLLTSQGIELTRFHSVGGGSAGVARKLEPYLKRTGSEKSAPRVIAPPASPPLFGGAPVAPPPQYTDLNLKGIAGAANRRSALINNTTLFPGETARVKVGDGLVKVRCVEVRERSVIVVVGTEKEPREIKLRQIF